MYGNIYNKLNFLRSVYFSDFYIGWFAPLQLSKSIETESEPSNWFIITQRPILSTKKFRESGLFLVSVCDFGNFTCARSQGSLSKIRLPLRSQSDCEFA